MSIPFFRPSIAQEEIDEVIDCLKSGWITTGARTKRFEGEFATFVGAKHAIALNSATAALHLGLEAIGLKRGDSVIVPTMTFAATAEIVRYFDAKPILVDCCESDFNLDVSDARRKCAAAVGRGEKVRAIIPVHYGGRIVDMKGVVALAREFELRIIEDAAHCCPAYYRDSTNAPWKSVGVESDVACYSFYANKCITTGEGGMACTDDDQLAERIRIMSLHGISHDAWKRFTSDGSWYYEILAPGFKYNLTDIAASIGIHQLRKANAFREIRERLAAVYFRQLSGVEEIVLPSCDSNRIHSWHLFVIRLRLGMLKIDRAQMIAELKRAGVGTSVHWMPLHMHPYYQKTYAYQPQDLPVSASLYNEIVSLPIYPAMSDTDAVSVCDALVGIIARHRKREF